MKIYRFLPLALATLLIGCNTIRPVTELDDTLPKLALKDILPPAADNDYCNKEMASDTLYGIGSLLFNNAEYEDAKTCLVMAAPQHPRAFCFLSVISDQESNKPREERDRESFNYLAYSALQKDWCAEYGMYQIYAFGEKGIQPDKPLALRWLERSAVHGNPEAQRVMAHKAEDLDVRYAWFRIINADSELDELRKRMSSEALRDGEERYRELLSRVRSQEAMYDEARAEDIGLYSGFIELNYPSSFKGISAERRRDFITQSIRAATNLPYIHSRGQVTKYILIARIAQNSQPNLDIRDEPRLTALLKDDDLSIDESLAQAEAVIISGS
ncbi:SEL1-like repeat protein [Pseudomonas sp. Marseille-QA0892]